MGHPAVKETDSMRPDNEIVSKHWDTKPDYQHALGCFVWNEKNSSVEKPSEEEMESVEQSAS